MRIEDIPHMREETLVTSGDGEQPWYISACIMVLLDCFCAGWIQRFKLYYNTYEVKYTLRKWIIS